MAATEERVTILEGRVGSLETWAGPGQIEVLTMGLAEVRADIRTILKTHVATLKTDVAEIKVEMKDLRTGMDALGARMAEMTAALALVIGHLGLDGGSTVR
jgi:hypothetical protein